MPIILSWFISPLLTAAASAVIYGLNMYFVLSSEHSTQRAVWVLPILIFSTVTIDIYFVFTKGAKKSFTSEDDWSDEKVLLHDLNAFSLTLSWHFVSESGICIKILSELHLTVALSQAAWIAAVVGAVCSVVASAIGIPYLNYRLKNKVAEREASSIKLKGLEGGPGDMQTNSKQALDMIVSSFYASSARLPARRDGDFSSVTNDMTAVFFYHVLTQRRPRICAQVSSKSDIVYDNMPMPPTMPMQPGMPMPPGYPSQGYAYQGYPGQMPGYPGQMPVNMQGLNFGYPAQQSISVVGQRFGQDESASVPSEQGSSVLVGGQHFGQDDVTALKTGAMAGLNYDVHAVGTRCCQLITNLTGTPLYALSSDVLLYLPSGDHR